MIYVIFYLAAIVAANLIVAAYGPSVAILNAFLFIGLDLTARDKLHDKWKGENLWLKMFVLILAGSLISYLFNRNAGPIALASFTAFLAAGVVDSVIYHFLSDRSKMVRVNGSNVFSAGVDSLVFPAMAFGFPMMWTIAIGQFLAKVLGGYVWLLFFSKIFEFEEQTT